MTLDPSVPSLKVVDPSSPHTLYIAIVAAQTINFSCLFLRLQEEHKFQVSLVQHALPIQDGAHHHAQAVQRAGQEVQTPTLAADHPGDHILPGNLADIPAQMEDGSDRQAGTEDQTATSNNQ